MDTWIIVTGIVVLIAIIAGIAYALKKAGFRTTKLKVKTGVLEAEMERTPADASEPAPDKTPTTRTEVRQSATNGGIIENSGITISNDSGAKVDQKAKDEGSKIDDSSINLT